MTTKMKCTSHTVYQPTEAEWKCPKCGEVPEFYIEVLVNEDCPKLHNEDVLRCHVCLYEISGKAFAALLMTAAKMTECPICKGKGTVFLKAEDNNLN